jgi:hypothetical protein
MNGISANHHWCCEFESRSGRGIQHYVIKFVSGFLRVLRFPTMTLLWCLTFGTLSLLLFFIIFYNNVNFNISKLLYVKSNLSKPNLIGTSLGIQNRQVFNLYKLNKRFSTLWFFYSLVYTGFWFSQVPV